MFAIEDKFGINREEKFTELGNKICLVCTSFEPRSEVNSSEIFIDFKWVLCVQSLAPFRNTENPTLWDYKYQEIEGAKGVRTYSNADKRIDLEIVDGVPQPVFEQAKDEFDNLLFEEDGTTPIMIPKTIRNIDFWMKFGGDGIIEDLQYTNTQTSMQPIETFYKS